MKGFFRGIVLKGNDLPEVMTHLWPIAVFMVVALYVAVKRYRGTWTEDTGLF